MHPHAFWTPTSLPRLVHCRLHNLAHVELNAIDLAWDTVARFSGLQMDQVCVIPLLVGLV